MTTEKILNKQSIYQDGSAHSLDRKQSHSHQLIMWLSVYGVFVGSIFFAKSLTMYVRNDTTSIISPVVNAQESFSKKMPKPTILLTPTPSDEKKTYIESKKHGDIDLRVWTSETTRGQNRNDDPTNLQVYCESKGLSNEFGYAARYKYCFSDFHYSVDVVDKWWDDCLQTRSLEQCLNRYSGNTVDYVSKFLSQSNH